jgi:hypothetical protein
VGDGLPAKWRGLEFRNWGLVVELRNYELSIHGLPVGTYLGFWGSAVQGCWITAGVLGYYWAGVLGLCDSAKFDWGGYIPRPTVPRPHRTIWV